MGRELFRYSAQAPRPDANKSALGVNTDETTCLGRRLMRQREGGRSGTEHDRALKRYTASLAVLGPGCVCTERPKAIAQRRAPTGPVHPHCCARSRSSHLQKGSAPRHAFARISLTALEQMLRTIAIAMVCLLVGFAASISTLFISVDVKHSEDARRVPMGWPLPFVQQDFSAYDPPTWPQRYGIAAPQEHPVLVNFASLLLDVLVFALLAGISGVIIRLGWRKLVGG